jgi:hypothetical protein
MSSELLIRAAAYDRRVQSMSSRYKDVMVHDNDDWVKVVTLFICITNQGTFAHRFLSMVGSSLLDISLKNNFINCSIKVGVVINISGTRLSLYAYAKVSMQA